MKTKKKKEIDYSYSTEVDIVRDYRKAYLKYLLIEALHTALIGYVKKLEEGWEFILEGDYKQIAEDVIDLMGCDPEVSLPNEETILACREELLKQVLPMTHSNGYPTYAVPKATILALPALMKVSVNPETLELLGYSFEKGV